MAVKANQKLGETSAVESFLADRWAGDPGELSAAHRDALAVMLAAADRAGDLRKLIEAGCKTIQAERQAIRGAQAEFDTLRRDGELVKADEIVQAIPARKKAIEAARAEIESAGDELAAIESGLADRAGLETLRGDLAELERIAQAARAKLGLIGAARAEFDRAADLVKSALFSYRRSKKNE